MTEANESGVFPLFDVVYWTKRLRDDGNRNDFYASGTSIPPYCAVSRGDLGSVYFADTRLVVNTRELCLWCSNSRFQISSILFCVDSSFLVLCVSFFPFVHLNEIRKVAWKPSKPRWKSIKVWVDHIFWYTQHELEGLFCSDGSREVLGRSWWLESFLVDVPRCIDRLKKSDEKSSRKNKFGNKKTKICFFTIFELLQEK